MSTYSNAPTGYVAAPTAAAAPSKRNAIFGAVGSAVALVGSLVNWTMAEGETGGIKGTDGDGVISLITAGLAAVLFIGAIVGKKAVLYIGGAALGLVTLIIGALNMADPERLFLQKSDGEGISEEQAKQAAEQLGLEFTTGPGVWMVLIGAVVALVFGALGFMKSRSSD